MRADENREDHSINENCERSPCKLQVNSEHNETKLQEDDEIEGELLNNLMEASKSFSQISIEESLDFEIDEDTLYFLEHEENLRNNQNSSNNSTTKVLASNSSEKDAEITSSEVKNCSTTERKNSADTPDFCLRLSSLNDHQIPQKFNTTSLQIPRESKSAGTQSPPADEAPPRKRLKLTPQKMSGEKFVQTDNSIGLKNHRNLSSSVDAELHYVKDRAPEVLESHGKEIRTSAVSRKRHLQDLTKNIYEASCYLDEIRRALAASNSESTQIPPPPKFNGYASQFEFPEHSRFSKLPITIENVGGGRRSALNDTSALKLHPNSSCSARRGQKLARKKMPVATSTSSKPINNKVEISLPTRFKKQQTIRQMFLNANKENSDTMDSQNKYEISCATSILSKVDSGKDTISDSGSMYDHNPYTRAKKTNN